MDQTAFELAGDMLAEAREVVAAAEGAIDASDQSAAYRCAYLEVAIGNGPGIGTSYQHSVSGYEAELFAEIAEAVLLSDPPPEPRMQRMSQRLLLLAAGSDNLAA